MPLFERLQLPLGRAVLVLTLRAELATSHAACPCNMSTPACMRTPLRPCSFVPRHNSTTPAEEAAMVATTGFASLDALIDATVPKSIRRSDGMDMGRYTAGMTESEFLAFFKYAHLHTTNCTFPHALVCCLE
jgi:Glycine cleavage system P-protein